MACRRSDTDLRAESPGSLARVGRPMMAAMRFWLPTGNTSAPVAPPRGEALGHIGAGERPTALVYRDFLLPFSETFIRAQAGALRRYAPVFVGRCEVAGIRFDPGETELVDDG